MKKPAGREKGIRHSSRIGPAGRPFIEVEMEEQLARRYAKTFLHRIRKGDVEGAYELLHGVKRIRHSPIPHVKTIVHYMTRNEIARAYADILLIGDEELRAEFYRTATTYKKSVPVDSDFTDAGRNKDTLDTLNYLWERANETQHRALPAN
ncbi:MAG: hypothetical protein HYW25_02675 [Candidatus Aenigmarchaeota archaeon]|nr:hypothetical protein [Candidatus Aenigmarchaeota archaeon]